MGYNIDITSNNGNLTSKSFYLPENPAWAMPIQNWSYAMAYFLVKFEGRI